MWQPIYRRLVYALALFGLLWLPGAATPVTAAYNSVEATGSLQGRVTNEQGQPLEGIGVDVFADFDQDGRWETLTQNQTDVMGNYQIPNLGNGAYRLGFYDRPTSGACEIRYAAEYYPNSATIATAQSLIINKGRTIGNLVVQLAETGRICGRVMDRVGTPLPGILVITRYDLDKEPPGYGLTETDAAGLYNLSVPDGIHHLYFFTYRTTGGPGIQSHFGHYAPEYYNDQSSLASATPIQIQNRVQITGIDAQLEPAGAIIGKLINYSDLPLAQIKVTAYSDLDGDGLWEAVKWNWIDNAGGYIVSDLPAGSYRLDFQDMRQPPLFHTRSFNRDYDLTAPYPEDGENLQIRTNADGAQEIIFLTDTHLPVLPYVNAPPLARYDRILVFSTTITNTLVADQSVLANDRDAERDPLTATLVSGPTQGTLSLATSGFFTYTPTAGVLISDTFTYRANDGLHDSNVVSVTIRLGVERSFLPVVQRGD